MTIDMVDLHRQRAALEPGLSQAMARVLEHGGFVGGPEVATLEAQLGAFVGVPGVVTCSNGTAALQLLLRTARIGRGDAVFVPSLTFAATAEAVALLGATPVFVDVALADGNLCPQSLSRAIASVRAEAKLTPRAVIAVDLFSLPSPVGELAKICAGAGLLLFFDAAHSVGTETALGRCGSFGDGAATSFYPSKAFGCYGDGGAVLTRDAAFSDRVRSIANHGAGDGGHRHVGMNSRLDTLQAAVLLQKLTVFEQELAARRAVAQTYRSALAGIVDLPEVAHDTAPAYSYFAIRHPDRDRLQAHLAERGIRSVAYYGRPTHVQPAYTDFPVVPGGLPNTMAIASSLLCLPMHPYLHADEVAQVVAGVSDFASNRRKTA